jgi:putative spermidine/putrescine transport system permease protein
MKRLGVAAVYGFLLAAPLVVLLYSVSPGVVLELPPRSLSFRWYRNLFEQPRLLTGIGYSTLVAVVATLSALVLGTPAAWALSRSSLPGRRGLGVLFLAPLNLPGLVLALGLLMALSTTWPGLAASPAPLFGVHLLVTLPWVLRTLSAALGRMDRHLEDAARGLGATALETFFLVTLPALRPALVASAIFAFIVSFGNFALSLFFSSGRVVTLPVALFEYMDQYQDPTAAAASSLVIVGTTALVVLASRFTNGGAFPG